MIRDLTLADGRTLRTSSYGEGRALLYHHGTPGSGGFDSYFRAAADQLGLQLISFDRAGYGGSSRNKGRSVADVAGDVEQVLDAYGVERTAVIGKSGGGPHALATGVLLPDRVTAVCVLAGVAPYDADGLDFLAGMGAENVEEFELALQGPEALQPFLDSNYLPLATVKPEDLIAAFGDLLPAADKAVMVDDYAEELAAGFHTAMAPGTDGAMDDDIAFTRPWGFELSALTRPSMLIQGSEDRMVPHAHGEWLAARIPGVQAQFMPGEGHLSIGTTRLPDIVRSLLALSD